MHIKGNIDNESSMMSLGAALVSCLSAGDQVFLIGDLGAGKTTLVRGFLRALGYEGTVNSPTYAMVESYDLAPYACHHFDGYRIHSSEEWLDMGIDDYVTQQAICLIEWPQSGKEVLPLPCMQMTIEVPEIGIGREVSIDCVKSELNGWEQLQACVS